MILIISDRADVQIYFVMLELEKMGIAYGLFNAADYPTSANVSLTFGDSFDECWFSLENGELIEASSVSAVWYRKPGLSRLHPSIVSHEREFTFKETRAGLRGLYNALHNAYWISPLENIVAASNKLGQLRMASQLGMMIPKTIFTNDVAKAQMFVTANGGRVIYKSAGDSALITREGSWDEGFVVGELYTTLLDEATINEGLSRISACPVLLQEYIEKDIELRVTVVGESVFVAELHSQSHEETLIDWRRGNIFAIEHRVHTLPLDVQTLCINLVRTYGLRFGAIDMIKKKDGSYVFLELNPNGQYGWVEGLTGLNISKAIATQLASAHSKRSYA